MIKKERTSMLLFYVMYIGIIIEILLGWDNVLPLIKLIIK